MDEPDKIQKIDTLLARAGNLESAGEANGQPGSDVVQPIHLSTTYRRDPDGAYPSGYVYSRSANPNRDSLEAILARLEGGAVAAAFASGSAATLAILLALGPGDRVIAPLDAYHGTTRLLREVLSRWNLRASFVDTSDTQAVRAALSADRTRLLWLETPSNPLLQISDIAELARLAHEAGATVVCDNTWGTPILQLPLELGADLVLHSTTKYLGGHSDVLGGAVITKKDDELFALVRSAQRNGGGVASPFDCWLIGRGLRTLHVRMARHCENAERVARYLATRPEIERICYPGLESHPGHEVARRQMRGGFGGMLSVLVREWDGQSGRERAFRLAARSQLFTRATSLGGTESLIEHRRSVEGPESTTPDNLLRISVGLEYAADLIADLEQALSD